MFCFFCKHQYFRIDDDRGKSVYLFPKSVILAWISFAEYVFDCFDSSVIGLAMDTNRKAPLCVKTLENIAKAYPGICGAIIHSDRGSQYTSRDYRGAICQYGIRQSMNSAGGRCHDNVRCESMWARMKSELFYDCYDTEK